MTEHFTMTAFLDLILTLAQTPGPSLGEAPRRTILEDFFVRRGVAYTVDRAGNLWVQHGQGTWEDSVVFDAHMDVVQEGFSTSCECREQIMTGLGVGDNLSAVTLLALFAVRLNRQKSVFHRPLYFLFSTGEEGDGNLHGVRQVLKDHNTAPHAFVSFDLSFDEYSVAGLGSIRYRADVSCPGGHSWSDHGIPGAIDQIMAMLGSLKQTVQTLSESSPGTVTMNVGTISGGEGINSIARKAMATFEFRSPDPSVLETVDKDVYEITKQLNAADSVDVVCSMTSRRPAAQPVCPERIEPHVAAILDGIGEKTKRVIRSTNINATLTAGWPSICLGLCTGGRFHTHEEFVRLDSIEKGWHVLGRLAEILLNTETR